MRVLRDLGNGLLWMLAVLGVLSGALWLGSQAGVVQPVVVISGSMSPEIRTGDLLIATRTPVEQLEPGRVATLMSSHTENFVTHRVVEVTDHGDHVAIRMQGDANASADAESYLVSSGAYVWTPKLSIPRVGQLATAINRPGVAIPGLISIVAVLILLSVTPTRAEAEMAEEPEREPVAV